MTTRVENGVAYMQRRNVENRLASGSRLSPKQTATFYYDGDGNRVMKAELSGSTVITTVYIKYFEKNLSTFATTLYYSAGGARVAMRQGSAVYYCTPITSAAPP